MLEPVRRALRWAWREILLALLAAFIVGLGAGAAEALISWGDELTNQSSLIED